MSIIDIIKNQFGMSNSELEKLFDNFYCDQENPSMDCYGESNKSYRANKNKRA